MAGIVRRSEWGALPPESVTLRDPTTLGGVVVHWFGSPRAAKTHAACPALLRAVQRAHMAGEFNDIAYNHLVCQHGVIFEGRGFGVQTGANGNRAVNEQYAAVCVMIGKGDHPAASALDELCAAIWLWRARGTGREVLRHGTITGSECPGPDIGAWVDREGYELDATPYQHVDSEMFRWFLWRDRGALPEERPLARVRRRVPPSWWPRYVIHRGRP